MVEPRVFPAAIWRQAARAHARAPELTPLAFGGSSGTTQTTQVSTPYSGQVPFLVGGKTPAGAAGGATPGTVEPGIFPEAANLYSHYTPSYFPTSTVSPFNPTQVAGQQAEVNLGASGTPAVNNAEGFFGNLENGNFLSAGNPYFKTMADQVKASVMPGLESQMTQGNNDNPAIAYATSKGVSDAVGGLAYQNYNDTLSKMVQGGLVAPGLQSSMFQDVGAIQDAGAQQQQQSQAQLSDLVNRYNYNQMLPYQKLNMFGQQVSGSYGGTSTLTQPYFQNQLANVLGTGFGLNSLASSAGFGGGGASAGLSSIPLISMIGSIFSDRRAKKIAGEYRGALADLKRLTVSRARYGWEADNDERPMLMADEVQEILPHAVIGDKTAASEDGTPRLQTLTPHELIPVMVAAINELGEKVDRIAARLDERDQTKRAA